MQIGILSGIGFPIVLGMSALIIKKMCMGAILYEKFSKIVYAATLQDSNDNFCPEMITDIDVLAKYSDRNIEIVKELHRDKAVEVIKNAGENLFN